MANAGSQNMQIKRLKELNKKLSEKLMTEMRLKENYQYLLQKEKENLQKEKAHFMEQISKLENDLLQNNQEFQGELTTLSFCHTVRKFRFIQVVLVSHSVSFLVMQFFDFGWWAKPPDPPDPCNGD